MLIFAVRLLFAFLKLLEEKINLDSNSGEGYFVINREGYFIHQNREYRVHMPAKIYNSPNFYLFC
ncbi:unnamed protein product [Meloidogyne enterolobii]|uniref:Uncharacterized protein n=2 Tax=Meloidogyne enterolobii TaxID=390850 RepID=A0ACB1B2T0_MELEN|nr:unnamed protein product [Meloidogyne enterolobii]